MCVRACAQGGSLPAIPHLKAAVTGARAPQFLVVGCEEQQAADLTTRLQARARRIAVWARAGLRDEACGGEVGSAVMAARRAGPIT